MRFMDLDLLRVLEEMAFLSEEVDWLISCKRPPAVKQLLDKCLERVAKVAAPPPPP